MREGESLGGQEGSRGYIYQGISAIFSSFVENDWSNISVEYKTKNDKVDIALLAEDESVMKTIQVKSSVNSFSKSMIKGWITELMKDVTADSYQLILIGNCNNSANLFVKSVAKYNELTQVEEMDKETADVLGDFVSILEKENVQICVLPFDEQNLMGIVRDSLNRYISHKGYVIDYSGLEELSYALLSLQMLLGTKGGIKKRCDYEKKIEEWLILSSNGGMKKKGVFSELRVSAVDIDNGEPSVYAKMIPFAKLPSLMNAIDERVIKGKVLIEKIEKIVLEPARKAEEKDVEDILDAKELDESINIDGVTYTKVKGITLDLWEKRIAEISEDEKEELIKKVKNIWDINLCKSFFNVGQLKKSFLKNSHLRSIDYEGTADEVEKNELIQELKSCIWWLEKIEIIKRILCQIHLIPMCISNCGNVADKSITVCIRPGDDYEVFSIESIIGDDRRLLDCFSDNLIEEDFLRNIIGIRGTPSISLENLETRSEISIEEGIFGRRTFDFEDFVCMWKSFQKEIEEDGLIKYAISELRVGETKWMAPYIMIIPKKQSIKIEYMIYSEYAGEKKEGSLTYDVRR